MIFPISRLRLLGAPWRAVGEGSCHQSPQSCCAVQTKYVEIWCKPLRFQNEYSLASGSSDVSPWSSLPSSRPHVFHPSTTPLQTHSPAHSVSLCSSSSLSSSLESPGRGPHTPSPISSTATQQVALPNGESAHTDRLLHSFFFSGMPLG